ncbi:hypothetical protein BT96DRAFT_919370 [Gymnopus androsaceus JB14]|uniref:Uncharacterized protein n=1 Tax=Gymnopus androsaceus JB14 TaxID=1447944 RepID=A0A6A4HRX9_9AGAR|nr:hypothetical protein BT96DRAFT_919370 [Gymnopus androsaceus JB14]
MRWLAPPTRREIAILLFAQRSSRLPTTLNTPLDCRFRRFNYAGVILSRLGYAPSVILKDGRRPLGWRDQLDDTIIGNHDWNDGEASHWFWPHSAMWIGKKQLNQLWPPTNEPGVSSGFWRWNDQVPTTTLVKHVPGYTILDQVIALNDILYIVTDDPESFPSVNSISTGEWEVISSQTARSVIGRYGGRVLGVSWMCNEPVPQNTTLLSLWSLYSTLQSSIVTSLPYPTRFILPQIPAFTDDDLDETGARKDDSMPRSRSSTGFHPFLPKAAFLHMGVLYQEDWADYMRLVVADYQVAGADGLSAVLQQAKYGRIFEEPEQEKTAVTYIHRPGALREEDHDALVRALNKMSKDRKVDVHFVEAIDSDNNAEWGERMAAIVKSNVILAVQGPDILDGVFLKPSPTTTMVELFSPNTASREHQSVAESLGINYIAWSNTRKLSSDEITRLSNSQNDDQGRDVPVDSDAIVKAIWDTLTR